MRQNEIRELIAGYNYDTFCKLSTSEWELLTNDFKTELVEDILLRLLQCYNGYGRDVVVEKQLKIFELIDKAYRDVIYDIFGVDYDKIKNHCSTFQCTNSTTNIARRNDNDQYTTKIVLI